MKQINHPVYLAKHVSFNELTPIEMHGGTNIINAGDLPNSHQKHSDSDKVWVINPDQICAMER